MPNFPRKCATHPTNQSANQQINQSTNQPSNQPTNQPASQPTSKKNVLKKHVPPLKANNQPGHQPNPNQPLIFRVGACVNQPTIQPTNQPVSQPASKKQCAEKARAPFKGK